MNSDQTVLLEKLEDVLNDIRYECYNDRKFSDIINHEVLQQSVDYLIDNIQNKL